MREHGNSFLIVVKTGRRLFSFVLFLFHLILFLSCHKSGIPVKKYYSSSSINKARPWKFQCPTPSWHSRSLSRWIQRYCLPGFPLPNTGKRRKIRHSQTEFHQIPATTHSQQSDNQQTSRKTTPEKKKLKLNFLPLPEWSYPHQLIQKRHIKLAKWSFIDGEANPKNYPATYTM